MKRRYFPGLNALRFYSALCVVIYHMSICTIWLGYPVTYRLIDFFFMNGADAVGFFFVLSGFLITFLLLEEREQIGINIPRFYARRALRIWPPYYIAVALGFLVIPLLTGQALELQKLPTTLLLMPNITSAIPPGLPYGAQPLWSIGVEEQFYLIWPFLIRRVQQRLPLLFAIIIVIRIIAGVLVYQTNSPFWISLISGQRLEFMAVGAFGAYFLYYKHSILKWIYHPIVQALALFIFLINIPFSISGSIALNLSPLWQMVLGIIFLIVIMNVANGKRSRLDRPIFNTLGNISYGMYVYHASAIYLVLFILSKTGSGLNDLIYYPAVIILTIAAAFASYRFVEKPFLRLKPQPIPTTHLANQTSNSSA